MRSTAESISSGRLKVQKLGFYWKSATSQPEPEQIGIGAPIGTNQEQRLPKSEYVLHYIALFARQFRFLLFLIFDGELILITCLFKSPLRSCHVCKQTVELFQ